MLKKLLLPPMNLSLTSNRVSMGLLILRVIVGVTFMMHGFGKIQAPFSWMGPDSTIPGFLQALAALAEFGGGLAWVIGLLTPLASLGILSTMLVATQFHIEKGDPYMGGYELAVVFAAIATMFIYVGPGKFSVDAKLVEKVK